MLTRRRCLLFAGCAAFFPFPTTKASAAEPMNKWSTQAFAAAAACRAALIRHPFLVRSFDGTLEKAIFANYLCQNIHYLENYARCLDHLAERVSHLSGCKDDSANLSNWASETRDLRVWTIEYASSISGKTVRADKITPLPELLAYEAMEWHYVHSQNPALAMAALLPCFWAWDEFGRALRPKARLQGNPFKAWVEGMGSKAAAVSAGKASELADRLSRQLSQAEQGEMTDVFAAGCWMEWQLFDATFRRT